jgi:glycosyltransferase involved in cell wall biosynthesis
MRGGMDVHGHLLAKGLGDRGHRVVFVATRHPLGKSQEVDGNVTIRYLANTVYGSRRHGWAEKSIRALEALHRQQPIDLIWSQSYDGFGLANAHPPLSRIPLLATLHGSIAQEWASFTKNFQRQWYHPISCFRGLAGLFYSHAVTQKPLLRYARRIVTVSQNVTEDLRKWYGSGVLEKCVTVYNGVDTDLFRPDVDARDLVRRRYGYRPKDLVLLTLGRLTREKGHHLLIEALAHLRKTNPRVKLLIVGEGEYHSSLQRLTLRLALDRAVVFAGSVTNNETVAFYNAADLFLFPTLTVEGLPFVLLEAMACGKPVIATDRGGNREVVHNGQNGILISPGSSQRIAAAIETITADRKMADRLQQGALATIHAEFGLVRMIDRMEEEMTAAAALRRS